MDKSPPAPLRNLPQNYQCLPHFSDKSASLEQALTPKQAICRSTMNPSSP